MGLYAKRLYRMKWSKVYPFMKVSSFIVYKGFIKLFLALYYIFFMIKQYANARIMKFIPNEIRIMFLGFLALLRLLIMILKTLMFDL